MQAGVIDDCKTRDLNPPACMKFRKHRVWITRARVATKMSSMHNSSQRKKSTAHEGVPRSFYTNPLGEVSSISTQKANTESCSCFERCNQTPFFCFALRSCTPKDVSRPLSTSSNPCLYVIGSKMELCKPLFKSYCTLLHLIYFLLSSN